MTKSGFLVICAPVLAVLLGCSADNSTDLPEELRELAENVYVVRDVLYLDEANPWRTEDLKRVADRTKPYAKVCLLHRFEGSALAALRGMPNLHSLAISEFSGSTEEGLQNLATLGQLRELTIYNPALARSALPYVAKLEQLEGLNLVGSELSDADLAAVETLRNLQTLSISDAAVTDIGLVHLSKLNELRRLQFSNSRVTYAGLLQLKELRRLEEVSITESPTWLFADQLEAMYRIWPGFRGSTLRGRDTAYLWNVEEKKLAAILPGFPTFSADGQLAATYIGRRFYLMDARTGTALRELAADYYRDADGLHFPIAFSQDGKWVAAGHPLSSLRVWNTGTGELRWNRRISDDGYAGPYPHAVLALSAEGDLLAAADYDGPIHIWNLDRDSEPGRIVTHAMIGLTSLTQPRRILARTGCELRLWNLEYMTQTVEIPGAISFALAADRETVFVHDPTDGIREHDLSDGTVVRSYQGTWPNRPDVQLSVLAPGGQYLATADSSGTISIWNVATGKLNHQVMPADCGSDERLVHHAWHFTPDAKYLVIRWFNAAGIQ